VNPFVLNLVLALVWAAMSGEMSGTSLFVGFVVGYLVLAFGWRALDRRSSYGRKVPQVVGFLLWFVWEIVVSSVRVAYEVVTPTSYARPGIVGVPLPYGLHELEIAALASAISLTPGTLSLDVSTDQRVLYVHCMFVRDPDELRESLRHGLVRRVLEVLR
jgi:multicomponent Na+:H+ antiporter subunit E